MNIHLSIIVLKSFNFGVPVCVKNYSNIKIKFDILIFSKLLKRRESKGVFTVVTAKKN